MDTYMSFCTTRSVDERESHAPGVLAGLASLYLGCHEQHEATWGCLKDKGLLVEIVSTDSNANNDAFQIILLAYVT